jgi:signal transduction histidine kinase
VGSVALADVVRELESAVEPELRRRDLTLICDPFDSSIVVRADPERLHQVLLNLIGNAIKFTPAGGSIHVTTAPEDDVVRISVSDTGIGIPAEQLERVFEPFFQVERGKTRAHAGIGLGLAIARDLARAMGGELRLTSELGRGTTAILELRRERTE